MPVYLVERNVTGVTVEDLAECQKKAIRMGRKMTAEGIPVRYLRSTWVPGENRCMCLFEARSQEDVRQANERGKLPYTKIVQAEDLFPGTPS
jgi:hypothetical protein